MATVPMFDPSGQVRMVPAEQATAAEQAGGKPAVKLLDPQGTPRWIPADQQDAAIQAGGKLAPDTTGAPDTSLPFYRQHSSAGYELGQISQGVGSSLSQVGHTAERLLSHVPGIGTSAGFQKSMADDDARANAPMDTPGKMAGAAIENILEFASGDEALKGLSIAEKVAKLGAIARTVEKYPTIARVLGAATREGAVGAAQGAGHGQSAGDAAMTGLTTAGGSAILSGAIEGAGKFTDALKPGTRTIAGVDIPELASQRGGKGPSIADVPEMQGQQQAGAQAVHTNMAQQAVRERLEKVNASRQGPTAISDPARMLPAPEGYKQGDYTFTMPTTEPVESVAQPSQEGGMQYAGQREVPNPSYRSDLEPSVRNEQRQVGTAADATPGRSFTGSPTQSESQWQYTPPAGGDGSVKRGGGGSMTTKSVEVAHGTLSQLDDLMESNSFEKLSPTAQARIQTAAEGLRQQIDDHGKILATSPHFAPVDVDAAVGATSNFRDAAAQIEAPSKAVYDVLGPEFSRLRAAEKATLKEVRQTAPGGPADARLAEIRKQQDDIFEANRHRISPAEFDTAREGFADARRMLDLHAAVEGSFNGIPSEVAARAAAQGRPLPRRMTGGDPAYKRLSRTLDGKYKADYQRILGPGYDSLYQVAHMLDVPQAAEPTSKLARAVAMVGRRYHIPLAALAGESIGHLIHIPGYGTGALAGVAVEHAYRRVINRIATDPAIAARIGTAVKGNVSHRIAAPLIAAMMQQQPPQQQPQENPQ